MNNKVNPWESFDDGSSTILGQIGGQSEAHLGKYDNLVELRYRSREEQIKEVTYLKLLADYDGIPKIYYDNVIMKTEYIPQEHRYVTIPEHRKTGWKHSQSNQSEQLTYVCVVERLYPIEGELSKDHVIEVCSQLVRLLKLLFDYNIVNPHIYGFIMQNNGKVYITDCRLWEWFSEGGGEKREMLRNSLFQVVRFLQDHTGDRSLLLTLKGIENFVANADEVNKSTISKIEDMLRWDTRTMLVD